MERISEWLRIVLEYAWLFMVNMAKVFANLVGLIPSGVFEFDTGTVENFKVGPLVDHQGNQHGPSPWFTVKHSKEDYKFKDALHGSLSVFGAQGMPFPKTSAYPYWTVDVISPELGASATWQQLKTLEVWLLDGYSVTGEHLAASLHVDAELNGLKKEYAAVSGATPTAPTKIGHNSWTKITGDFVLPQGAKVRNVVIRVRGDWADSNLGEGKFPLFEGAIAVDHVAAA